MNSPKPFALPFIPSSTNSALRILLWFYFFFCFSVPTVAQDITTAYVNDMRQNNFSYKASVPAIGISINYRFALMNQLIGAN
jgi:hypothetical protein